MTEEKYNTKDIRHINKKNQEYIAEGNRMTEEILKCVKGESCIHCGSTYCRFVDEVNELEQENKALQAYKDINEDFKQAWYELNEKYKQLRSTLEEIREIAEKYKDMEGCRIPLGAIKMTVDKVSTSLK